MSEKIEGKVKGMTVDSELRQRAEKKLQETSKYSKKLSGMSPDRMATLIHEFEVHQIELEIQNDELRSIQGEIEKTRSDIAEQKLAQEQRDKLIGELQKALSEVKTLRGYLPICSHCKNIRDAKGYWSKIESYIRKHSDTKFSHGICPECAKKHFPEVDIYDDNGEVTEY